MDNLDFQLIASVQQGLPLVEQPYALIAAHLGISETSVIERLARLKAHGLIKRWGVIVKHRELGYRANAMIVIDVADDQVAEAGARLSRQPCVNLCYRRPRQGEIWPYNLYCMIHGTDRDTVLQQWAELRQGCGIESYSFDVLFSKRCFKQRGALYGRHRDSLSNRQTADTVVEHSHQEA